MATPPKKAAAAELRPAVLAPPSSVPLGALQIHVGIEPKVTGPKYYANHAEVNITPFEMTLTFARLPSRFDSDEIERLERGETLTLPSEAQISLPLKLIPSLITAMQTFIDQFPELSEQKPNE